MKIDFICSNQNVSIGSYRIWVHDLVHELKSLNIDAQVFSSISQIRNDSIIILSKGDYNLRAQINEKRCVGAINISSDCKVNFDFVIVGSIEEKKSLESHYENVVIINLIEKMYENETLKVHKASDSTIIGFHGSFTHLSKMRYGFSSAINQLIDKGHKIEIVCLTDEMPSFQMLKMLNINSNILKSYRWSQDSAKSIIQTFDIGIVQNTTDLMQVHPELKKLTSLEAGLYNTDYSLRFKNKSNPGRAFVFFQLGIPVIADLTPSNIPMFYDESCGYIATCSKTWEKSIIKLMDSNHRNMIAKNAYERFKLLYSFKDDAKRLVDFLKRTYNNVLTK